MSTTTQVGSESRGQYKAKAYAATSAISPLAPTTIPRRDPDEDDVQIEILFCGICHSDLHQVRNEWSAMPTVYPCVPGHEIVGRVTKVGSAVTKFKPGEGNRNQMQRYHRATMNDSVKDINLQKVCDIIRYYYLFTIYLF